MLYKGIAASPGLAIGKCLVIRPLPEARTGAQSIAREQIEQEKARLAAALQKAAEQLERIQIQAQAAGYVTKAEIIAAQSLMLIDPVLMEGANEKIENYLLSAERAVEDTVEEQAAILSALDDAYLRERAQDVRDIGSRLVGILSGVEGNRLIQAGRGSDPRRARYNPVPDGFP